MNRLYDGPKQFEQPNELSSVYNFLTISTVDFIIKLVDEELTYFPFLINATKTFFEPWDHFSLHGSFYLQNITLDKDFEHQLPEVLILDKRVKENFCVFKSGHVEHKSRIEESQLMAWYLLGISVKILD